MPTVKPASDNSKGAAFILASALTFALSVCLIKFLGQNISAPTQAFFRQLFALAIMVPLIARDPIGIMRTSRPRQMIVRTAGTSAGIILSYAAYQHLKLADANALSFARQLFIVPLAVIFIGERMDWQRIAATFAGFAGILVVLQPGEVGSFTSPYALCGLLAAFLAATSIISVKSLSRDHSQTTLLAWSVVMGAVLTLPPALVSWQTPNLREFACLATIGVLSTITQALYIRGITLGEASFLAPLDYTRIIFTGSLGYLLFAELPTLATLVGSAIVIAAAIYIVTREHRLRKAEIIRN